MLGVLRRDFMNIGLLIILLIMVCAPAWPSPVDPRPVQPAVPLSEMDKNLKDHKNINDTLKCLDRQHEWTCYAVDSLLRTIRPSIVESPAHRAAVLALDEAIHYPDPDYTKSPAALDFLKRRLELAAYEIERTHPTQGAVIWHLYNDAFVIKTKSVTFAFDLTRGCTLWWEDTDLQRITKRIIDQCDAMFISHDHGDHNDPWVVEKFKAQSKPAYLPGELPRDGKTLADVNLPRSRKLRVVTFPGYQSETIDNVSIVYTPENLAFTHTGDFFIGKATPTDMWSWVDHVKDNWKTNVLLLNIWAPDLQRVAQGFNPDLVIPGHENELGHGNDKRKPYWLDYDRLSGVTYPSVVMTWGESYFYLPEGKGIDNRK